jgi:hypothetical protein
LRTGNLGIGTSTLSSDDSHPAFALRDASHSSYIQNEYRGYGNYYDNFWQFNSTLYGMLQKIWIMC